MHCPACREVLPDGARFCGMCGFKLDSTPRYPSPPSAPEEPILLDKPIQRPARDEPILLPQQNRTDRDRNGGERKLGRAKTYPSIEIPAARIRGRARPPPTASPARPPAPAIHSEATLDLPRQAVEEQLAGSEAAQEAARGATSASTPERRAPRVAFSLEVTLGSEHNFYHGLAENISEGGLFVATHDVKPIGTRIDIEFALPELRRTCRASCEVCWVREFNVANPDMIPGMGLRFLELTASDQRTIEVFLKHRDPIFYDDE